MKEALTYNIDSALSLRYRTPVIIISKSTITDDALIASLMDDERQWQKRETKLERLRDDVQYPFFRLRPLHSYQLLQKLVLTQKLLFNGKRILGDFFTKLKLEYLVEQTENTFKIHALLNNKALDEYDLILQGSPHIAISKSKLEFCDPNIAWQDLSAFLQGPKVMNRSEYLQFKKEVEPSSIIELDSFKEETPLSPLVQLTDDTCSFVKLAKEHFIFEQDLIKAGYTKKDLGISTHYCPTDKSLAAVDTLLKAGWKVLDAKGKELILLTHSDTFLEKNFTITGSVFFAKHQATLADVAKSMQQNARILDLGDKSGLLSFENHKELKCLLMQVELMSNGKARFAKSGISNLSGLSGVQFEDETFGKRMLSDFRTSGVHTLPASGFKGDLRAYQQEGLNWLIALYESGLNGFLADEMGLGKTVQVLAFLSHITARTLIVVPTSLLHNWKREIEHFLPHKSHSFYHGQDRKAEILENFDITITSYATLRGDIDVFTNHEFECIILDEAQAIKNSSTLTAQAIFQLKGRFRLSLTGTPIENSLDELYCHFHFLEPGLLDSKLPLAQLRKKIAPFFLRRKKCEVAKDLPDKIEEIVWVTQDAEQKLLYDRFMAHLKAGLLKKVSQDGIQAHRMQIFEALLRLRQICCHPALVPQLTQVFAPEATTSAKYNLVLEDLETLLAEGKKVVLFSQFTSMLHILAQEAKKRCWGHLLLEGQTKNRQELVDTFQNTNTHPLFLISLKAGGVGLNLTAADYVLLYDPWWNRAQEDQAIDRAHRIGRKDTVFSKRYYVQGSIEEKILALQEKKGQIAHALFEETSPAGLTIDDLNELFD